MTNQEIKTLVDNAFRLPRLASRHEALVGRRIKAAIDGGKSKKTQPQAQITANSFKSTGRKHLDVAGAISDKPLTRPELRKMLPNHSSEDIRIELTQLIKSGVVSRAGAGGRITYVRR